jgi:hypothetical protein
MVIGAYPCDGGTEKQVVQSGYDYDLQQKFGFVGEMLVIFM